MITNLLVPLNAGNFLTKSEPVSFSGRTLLHGVSLRILTTSSITRQFFLVNLSLSKVMISVVGYLMLPYHYINYLMSYVIKRCLSICMHKQEKEQP